MKYSNILLLSVLFFVFGYLVVDKLRKKEWKNTTTEIVKEETTKVNMINLLIEKVDSLTAENVNYEIELKEILQRKNHYKGKFHNFKLLPPIIKTVYMDADTIEITKEIESKVNSELVAEIEMLKITIEQMKTKKSSELFDISEKLILQAVYNTHREKPKKPYKFSLLAGYGFRSDLRTFKPYQVYNVGFSYNVSPRLGISLITDFAPAESIGLNVFLKYNYNN